jgi:hypothetical protein
VGGDLIVEVEATDNDSDHLNDKRTATELFTIEVRDDDDSPPHVDEYECDKTLSKLTFHVKLQDASGIKQNSQFPKMFYSHNSPVTDQNSKVVMTPDTAKGQGWYTCEVSYTLPLVYNINNPALEKQDPYYMYWKIYGKDKDDDRAGDAKVGWTNQYSQYITGPIGPVVKIDSKDFQYQRPIGDRRWDSKFDWYKFEKGHKPERFYKGPPPKGPGPFPQCMDDKKKRRVRIHYYLDGARTKEDMVITANAKEVKGGDFYVRVKHENEKGKITLLGTYKFSRDNKSNTIPLGKESTSTGKNTLIIEAANIPAKDTSMKWESIRMEEKKDKRDRKERDR